MDHVRPRSKGGSDSPDNLRPICTICNSAKGSKWLGEGRVDELRQLVAEDVWRQKRGELSMLYREELIGSLSEELENYKVRLEGQFSPEERGKLREWTIQQLGGSQRIQKVHRTEGKRMLVSRSRSGGFVGAYDEVQTRALEEHLRKKKELQQALRSEGIERPPACEECGVVSAIRPDGGRSPLYPIPRVKDGSPRERARSVIWKCKNCWERPWRARRARGKDGRPNDD